MNIISSPPDAEDTGSRQFPPLPAPLLSHELEECSCCRDSFTIWQVRLDETGEPLCATCSNSNQDYDHR